MSGIGYPKNKLITVEILRSSDFHSDGTETNIFFNARINEIRDVTERQRMNFYKKKGAFCSTTNTDVKTICEAMEKALSSGCVSYSVIKKVV